MPGMKRLIPVLIYPLIYFLAIHYSFCQGAFTGVWKGTFMSQFDLSIEFKQPNGVEIEGHIILKSGEQVIQNDRITNIVQHGDSVTFYIPAKETPFSGMLNPGGTELSGAFTFPDQSKHPVHLTRQEEKLTSGPLYELLQTKKYAKEALQSDLEFIFSSLENYHPRLYAYTPRDKFTSLSERLKNEITDSLKIRDFFLVAAQLTDAVKCSHTGIRLPATFRDELHAKGHCFPLKLFFRNGRAYVISSPSKVGAAINAGDEITSINKRPVREIISKMAHLVPKEGCNTSTLYHEMNQNFTAHFLMIDDAETFDIEVKTPSGRRQLQVRAEHCHDALDPDDSNTPDRIVVFKIHDKKSTAVLKIHSFSIPDMDAYFRDLENFFEQVRNNRISHLVLDLRGNSGGHPIFAAQLLSYFVKEEFTWFKRNDAVTEFEPLYQPMDPNQAPFSGKLLVLLDGGCLSTTGHLISLLKEHTNALFIGEEPGSSYLCNDFSIQATLPNTGIEINIPRATFETVVTGFSPCQPFPLDYRIDETIADKLQQRDPWMDRAWMVIEGNGHPGGD